MWAVALCGLAAARYWGRWRGSGQRWFDFFQVSAMTLFARVWHRAVRRGPDRVPRAGPVLVIANHPSHADPAFLMAGCGRPLHFLQAREQFEVPVLRRLFRRAGCIPVARDGHEVAGVRAALRRLKEGAALALFPEGEVSPPGKDGLGPVKSGAALLALRSGAPVVPAWIAGGPRAHDLLRDWLWPSGGVRVTFGPPVDLTPYRGRPVTRELLREVSDLLARRLLEVRNQADKVTK